MGKECFTCEHKISTELTVEERKAMREAEKAKGIRFPHVPELLYTCGVTKKQIKQTDPACDNYKGDDFMEELRVEIAKTAKKLREELND